MCKNRELLEMQLKIEAYKAKIERLQDALREIYATYEREADRFVEEGLRVGK